MIASMFICYTIRYIVVTKNIAIVFIVYVMVLVPPLPLMYIIYKYLSLCITYQQPRNGLSVNYRIKFPNKKGKKKKKEKEKKI